jgi:hypothetical protein
MTTTIYINPYVFEKHGPRFSEYIGLCIKHHKDKRGENTEFHHIFPEHKGGTNLRWNKVHLEYELHIEAHRLLMDAFPEDTSMKSAYTKTKYRGSNRGSGNPMFGRIGELHPSFGRTGEANGMYGNGHLVSGENNGMFGKTGELHPMFGRTGENNPIFGTKLRRVKCEYCGGDFAINVYTRHHGEKCKLKT